MASSLEIVPVPEMFELSRRDKVTDQSAGF